MVKLSLHLYLRVSYMKLYRNKFNMTGILDTSKTKHNLFYTLLTMNYFDARMTQQEEKAVRKVYLSFVTKDLR